MYDIVFHLAAYDVEVFLAEDQGPSDQVIVGIGDRFFAEFSGTLSCTGADRARKNEQASQD